MILNNLKQFLKNRFFTKNAIFCIFLDFLTRDQNIDFLLKIHEKWLKILPKASPTPQTYPKYIGWCYIMIFGRLKKLQKSIIFRHFLLLGPKGENDEKWSIFAIFSIFQKSLYNIIQCIWDMFGESERLLEVFLTIFREFWAKNRYFGRESKNPKKCKKLHFLWKIDFSKIVLNCSKSCYMAGNGSPGCFRTVLHPKSISELI